MKVLRKRGRACVLPLLHPVGRTAQTNNNKNYGGKNMNYRYKATKLITEEMDAQHLRYRVYSKDRIE